MKINDNIRLGAGPRDSGDPHDLLVGDVPRAALPNLSPLIINPPKKQKKYTINRIAIITTINRIAIITTNNRIAIIATINRIAIITTIEQPKRSYYQFRWG